VVFVIVTGLVFVDFLCFVLVLGTELRVLLLLGKHYHFGHVPTPFVFSFVFQIGSCCFAWAAFELQSYYLCVLSFLEICGPLNHQVCGTFY
jgi:hypothetical protein